MKRIIEQYPFIEVVLFLLFFGSLFFSVLIVFVKAETGKTRFIESRKPIKPEIHLFVNDGKVTDTIYVYIQRDKP